MAKAKKKAAKKKVVARVRAEEPQQQDLIEWIDQQTGEIKMLTPEEVAMMPPEAAAPPEEPESAAGGSYFSNPKANIEFISSGSTLLDLALGGGWVEDRIGNVVGDKAVGKTLLMIEAAANFKRKYPRGKVKYRECESAFDEEYAQALGMPVDDVDFGDKPIDTVEDFFEDLEATCDASKGKDPTLYILDSLDALTDRAEAGRTMDEGSYGTGKAKMMSQLFRRLVRKLAAKRVTLLIVSQVRAAIGVTFGRQTTRTGGKALDFYASQILYLAQLEQIPETRFGIKRIVAIRVRGKLDKNKIALPYREAEFNVRFGYGIEDTTACLKWLRDAKALDALGIGLGKTDKEINAYVSSLANSPDDEYWATLDHIHEGTRKRWYEVEHAFLPPRRKYADAA